MSQYCFMIATKNTMTIKDKKPKNMIFAAYLTQLRLKLPLRKNRPVFKKEVAVEAGVNISSYSMAENGVVPGDSVLYKLSKYFNVLVDDFKNKRIDYTPKVASAFRESKSELQDGEGPYGKTHQHDVEGGHLTITEFGPKDGQVKGPLRAAMEGLGEIFDSNDPILIPAIQANIRAFQLSARREHDNTQQAQKIKALEDKCDEFKKRLEDLERKLEDNPPHDHKEVPIERKVI